MLPLKYSAVAKALRYPATNDKYGTAAHATNGQLPFYLQVVQHSPILRSPSKFSQSRARPYSHSLSCLTRSVLFNRI